MPQSIYGQILFGFVVISCLFALWKGETAERRAAALLIADDLLSFALQNTLQGPLRLPSLLAENLLMMALLALIAWSSRRSWPVWATCCQAIVVAVVATRIVGLRMLPSAYSTAINLANYGVVAALAVGTFIVWREREALRSFGEPV